VVGLLGFLASAGRLVWKLIADGGISDPPAAVALSLMAVLCGTFVVLCIRSFIAARRSRAAQQTNPG
jgi:hypothetical protein